METPRFRVVNKRRVVSFVRRVASVCIFVALGATTTTTATTLPRRTTRTCGVVIPRGATRNNKGFFPRRRLGAPNTRRCVFTTRMVFSGIVEEMGEVVSLTQNPAMRLWDGSLGEGTELVVRGPLAAKDAYVGCSIAVDGVCLTATEIDEERRSVFKVGLSPETLRRTTLGRREAGDKVNLERSLPADGRNSGHYVQGHVDGTGEIAETWRDGDSLWVRIRPPVSLRPFIVEKGYVAVDGTSLTVCDVDDDTFTLMLVEHTQKCVVLPTKPVGDLVNLEVDVMAKYAQNLALGQMQKLEARVAALEARLAEVEEEENTGTACTGLD